MTIVEFSDFECGHCRAYRALKQVLPRYRKDVQVRFHHFPLDAACNPAVQAGDAQVRLPGGDGGGVRRRAGQVLGVPRPAVRESVGARPRQLARATPSSVGLDRAAFLACLDSDAPREAIARDIAAGMRLGIESTPTLYLNGRTITGAPRADALGYAIQSSAPPRRARGLARAIARCVRA